MKAASGAPQAESKGLCQGSDPQQQQPLGRGSGPGSALSAGPQGSPDLLQASVCLLATGTLRREVAEGRPTPEVRAVRAGSQVGV